MLLLERTLYTMNIKKCIAVALVAGSIFSISSAEATPTMHQAVSVPQYTMNPNENANYVLVWSHLNSKYYIDLASIVVKENNAKMRWWAENIVELNKNNEYVNQFPREYCYDRTNGNTRMWNYGTGRWENLETYDCRSTNQLEARSYNLGYIFAFQGGNPVEK